MIKHNSGKYFLSCIFCLLSFIVAAQTRSGNVQTIDGKKFYIHKIEKSQSLYAVSKLYNVTLDQLYQANPELKSGAKAGQEIKIPYVPMPGASPQPTLAAGTPSAAAIDTSKYLTYKTAKGETVYAITHKFNLSEKQLMAYNPALAQGLKEGQLVIIGEKPKRRQSKESKDKPVVSKDNKPGVKETRPALIDSSLLKPVSKPKKNSYTIALILPFRLEQTLGLELSTLVKTQSSFPNVPALAIDFYLGFKRAVDSLSAKDFEISLELYDVDDKDSLKLVQLAGDPKFREFDLIFGPLYASGFKSIAKKAKELHIPIVSPITQQNKILFNNNYISKTNPSQFTLLESLADYCIDTLMKDRANIILVSAFEKDKKETAFVSAFKKYYNDRQKAAGRPLKDTVKIAKGLAGVKAAYVPDQKNIIVSLSSNPVFIADFSTQLALFADNKDVVLCGWEGTSNNENITQEYLNQLKYTFPHQYNFENTAAYRPIIASYQEQQNAFPGEYFFVGFDIAYYYLKNLRDIGPDFVHTLNTLPLETNYMRFKFSRPDNNTGFDNRGVYIFKYDNYQIQKTGWK